MATEDPTFLAAMHSLLNSVGLTFCWESY